MDPLCQTSMDCPYPQQLRDRYTPFFWNKDGNGNDAVRVRLMVSGISQSQIGRE